MTVFQQKKIHVVSLIWLLGCS